MITVNKEIHGEHPMSELEAWQRAKCTCLNEADAMCSEHGEPHDRMVFVEEPREVAVARLTAEECRLRGIT